MSTSDLNKGGGGSYAFPLGGKYTVGRTDRGVDFETSPGTPVLALFDGIVTALNGFFPQIVLRPTSGSVSGYPAAFYGHLSAGDILVRPGQHVTAGQIIAKTSKRPPLAENMPGHIEIGLATNTSGSIEPAHDDSHNTRSGNTIAALLRRLGLPGEGKTGNGSGGIFGGAGSVAGDTASSVATSFPTPDEIAKALVGGIVAALGKDGLKIVLTIGLVFAGIAAAGVGTARLSGARVRPEDVAALATAGKGKKA